MAKIYTRGGDNGRTALIGGQKISKASVRVESYGCVDELITFIASAAEAMRSADDLATEMERAIRIQNELFNLASDLAAPTKGQAERSPRIGSQHIAQLESEVDEMSESLPALKAFILPGGGEISVRLHLARAICRNAERATVRLAEAEVIDECAVPYLNRLSDWLFVAARLAAKKQGCQDVLVTR